MFGRLRQGNPKFNIPCILVVAYTKQPGTRSWHYISIVSMNLVIYNKQKLPTNQSDQFTKIKMAADLNKNKKTYNLLLTWTRKCLVNFSAPKSKLLLINHLRDYFLSCISMAAGYLKESDSVHFIGLRKWKDYILWSARSAAWKFCELRRVWDNFPARIYLAYL